MIVQAPLFAAFFALCTYCASRLSIVQKSALTSVHACCERAQTIRSYSILASLCNILRKDVGTTRAGHKRPCICESAAQNAGIYSVVARSFFPRLAVNKRATQVRRLADRQESTACNNQVISSVAIAKTRFLPRCPASATPATVPHMSHLVCSTGGYVPWTFL